MTNTINTQYNSNTQQASGSGKSLGQADFMRLMTEQMRQQDPTKPMDSTQMLAQLAQFSQVQGINDMQAALGSMATVMENDQALRAAGLINNDALIATDKITIKEGATVSGTVTATSGGPLQIDILDANGNRVARRTIEAEHAGDIAWEWDGKDDSGNTVSAGTYTIAAGTGTGENTVKLTFLVNTHIDTISFGAMGMALNTGLGPFTLSQLRRIG